MKLKVYGWQAFRSECPPAPNGSRQTREIVAAKSAAEVARIAGETGPWKLFNLCQTGNDHEIATAMQLPGTIFWRSLNDYKDRPQFTQSK